MKYADLHIHSSYSDGELTPEEIVKLAIKNDIKCISITDHDTIESQYIINEEHKGIDIISGVEFSCIYKEIDVHILGYFVDIKNKTLIETLNEIKYNRISRVKKILKKLALYNIDIDIEDVLINSNMSIGRGNIANAMVKKGYCSNYKEAFLKYLAKGKLAYVKGQKMSVKDVIGIINDSGGMAVVAHPGKIYKKIIVESIIKTFKCYGLKGIEVYHPSHTREQTNLFYNLSKKYKLMITGGSDFHHKSYEHKTLGELGIDYTLLNKLCKNKK